MNSYYTIVDKIRELFEENGEVKTIIHGRSEDKDLYKKSIYPLAHILPIQSDMSSSQQNVFIFDISVLDQRDISKRIEEDKFEQNDDQQDNLNLTYAALNYVITKLRLQNNDERIELLSVSNVIPVLFKSHNLLDGWVATIALAIPNDVIKVC